MLLLLDELRDGIWTLSYGERNPVNEYKIRGFQLFNESISRMKNDIVGFILTASDKVSESIVTEYGGSILPAPPAEAGMPDMHFLQRQKNKAIISAGGVKRKKTRRSRRSV